MTGQRKGPTKRKRHVFVVTRNGKGGIKAHRAGPADVGATPLLVQQ